MPEQPTNRFRLPPLDLIERVVLAALFTYFVYNVLGDFLNNGRLTSLLLVVSETAVLVFVLIRRGTSQISPRPVDWALAFGATLLPLSVIPGGAPIIPAAFVLAMMVGGAVIQIAAKLYLRRSFGVVAANRGVMIGGPYRLVRHPMYAGYILTQAGFLLANPTAWNLAVYCLAWGLQVMRMRAEERILIEDSMYQQFSARVRYRLVPGVF